MLPMYLKVDHERERNEEHRGVGREVETGLDIGIVLESGTLIVWRWLMKK